MSPLGSCFLAKSFHPTEIHYFSLLVKEYEFISLPLQVVCSDIRQQAALLQEADVIVMNNVFEAFLPLEDQARWVP